MAAVNSNSGRLSSNQPSSFRSSPALPPPNHRNSSLPSSGHHPAGPTLAARTTRQPPSSDTTCASLFPPERLSLGNSRVVFTRSPGFGSAAAGKLRQTHRSLKTLLPPQFPVGTIPCLTQLNRMFTSREAAKCGDDRVFHTSPSPQAFPRIYAKISARGKSFYETRFRRLRGTAFP